MVRDSPRIGVIVPCYNDGRYVEETVASVAESEPVEIVVVDDCSTDADTVDVLARMAGSGVRVVHHETNRGVGAARNTGLANTSADFVFPLDSDDLACPGMIVLMAQALEADPAAAVAYGDYGEFGEHDLVRAVPATLDAFRVSYTNEYPPTALFRRDALIDLGGWDQDPEVLGYEDWDLWMKLAEDGRRAVFMGHGTMTYRQRVHGPRLLEEAKKRHHRIYRYLRARHPLLFSRERGHRRDSHLSSARKLLYPILYGRRRRFSFEPRVKGVLDKLGVWTLRR